MSLGTFTRRAALLAALTPASALAQPIPTVPIPPPSPLPAPAPTPPAAEPSAPSPELCAPPSGCRPLACAPRQRVIVVKIPAPEVVFQQVGHKAPVPCGPCTPKSAGSAPPAGAPQQPIGAAPPTGATGTATVYQTYNVPYVTYNWVPATQQSIGFAGAAPGGVLAAGGIGVAPQLIGANTGAVGFGPFSAELEIMLARALLNRFLPSLDRGQAADPTEAKIRALQQQIADLDQRIEALRKDTRDATLLNTKAIVDLHKEVDQLFNAINKLNSGDSKEKIVEDLQDAVKKIQAARPK
jgi:hypothetical protein